MQAVKKINNNVAVCLDSKGNEVIAFGKGIGYPKMPYEVSLSDIERTFYNINEKYLGLLNDLPMDVIEFTAQILAVVQGHLEYELNPNLVLTLADHLSFAMERQKKGIYIQMPLIYDMEQQYPEEIKISRYIVKKLNEVFHVKLRSNELSGIAMSIISAKMVDNTKVAEDEQPKIEKVLHKICKIIEESMGIVVDKKAFSYARFATHMNYLLERISTGQFIDSDNANLYQSLRNENANVAKCVDKIIEFLNREFKCEITEEEQMYLILHVNRICMKEGL